MTHILLLGDSILDNGEYVPGWPSVSKQLQQCLNDRAGGWDATVTLGAVDGSITSEVSEQLARRPTSTTHIVISTGGNDALEYLPWLHEPTQTIKTALDQLSQWREAFRADYRALMKALHITELPVLVCTVYDSIPSLDAASRTALVLFNEVILRETNSAGFQVLDLRQICDDPRDYSGVSDIEPSARGGAKIADAVARWSLNASELG